VDLGSLLRPRLVLPLIGALLLVAAGLFWVDHRDRVAWSITIADASQVADVDADRVLVRTSADALVVLDRGDGEELTVAELPAGAEIAQAVLLPDGRLLASWSTPDDQHQAALYDARGRQVWQRRDGDGLWLLGVLPDLDRVAARTSGADGALLGLGLDDGGTTWRRPLTDDRWPSPLDTGQALLEIEVTVAPVGGGPPVSVDLADGRTTGTVDADPADVTDIVCWHDTAVVALADGRVLRSTGGEPTDLAGLTGTGPVTFDPVRDGLVTVRGGDDEGRVLDVVQGEVEEGEADAARVESEDPGRAVGWLRGTDEDVERLVVVDADGDPHGSLVVPAGTVTASTVVGEHEAVVLTEDRVVLLGRD
jgi:hypothetical protein